MRGASGTGLPPSTCHRAEANGFRWWHDHRDVGRWPRRSRTSSRSTSSFLESLGGVESLIEHPAIMTTPGPRGGPGGIGDRRWIGPFSCGIEEAEDLLKTSITPSARSPSSRARPNGPPWRTLPSGISRAEHRGGCVVGEGQSLGRRLVHDLQTSSAVSKA